MGQAKNRGTKEERIAQAKVEQMREEPINVPCKTCGEVLNGFTLLATRAVGAAWQKTCACGAVTTALVQAHHSSLARTFKATLSMKEDVVGKGNEKVSVSFLEKTVDTVETGLVRLG